MSSKSRLSQLFLIFEILTLVIELGFSNLYLLSNLQDRNIWQFALKV
jgi:uncharacterized protein (DUF486 family)